LQWTIALAYFLQYITAEEETFCDIDFCFILMFSILIILETYDKVKYTKNGQTLWLILFQCITAKEKKKFYDIDN